MKTTYYISHGQEQKMYTLRMRFNETQYSSDGFGGTVSYLAVRDWHIVNLAIDADRAKAKAAELMATKYEGGYFVNAKLESLSDIRRRSAEELEALGLVAEAKRQQNEIEHYELMVSRADSLLDDRLYPFGKYKGKALCEAPTSYIAFLLSIKQEREGEFDHKFVNMANLQAALMPEYGYLLKMPTPNQNHYGEAKKREDFAATLIKVFSFEGNFGTTYVCTLVKDSGECLQYMGTTLPFGTEDLGKEVKFKATVKCHDEYQGQAQTKIQRIKTL